MNELVELFAKESRKRPDKFKVTDREARLLSSAMAAVTMSLSPSKEEIYEGIKLGGFRLYGIPVEVMA